MKRLLLLLTFVAFSFGLSAQTVFSENFNSSTDIPAGWTVYADNLTNYAGMGISNQSWFVESDFFDTGDNSALSISWTESGGHCDRWLVTPAINVNQSGLYLKFKLWGYTYGIYAEQIRVYVSTTDNQKSSFSTLLYNYTAVPSGITEPMFDLSAFEGETIYIGFQNYGNNRYVALDNIEVLVPAQINLEITNATMPTYVQENTDAVVSATIKNSGIQNITSFDAYYVIDGTDTTPTQSISGLNIPYYGEYNFNFTEVFNQDTEGEHTVQVVVTNVNGQGSSCQDQTSITTTVYDPTFAVPRTILLEQFTTCQCVNCPRAIEDISEALEGRDDVIWIAHHAGYRTDDMTCTENQDLLVFYNDDGHSYAPAYMLDRTHMDADEPGPAMYPGSDAEITAQLDDAASAPTFVSISIDNYTFDVGSNQISVNVSGQFYDDMTFDSPRLSIYLIEDGLRYNQEGYGMMTHNAVMRNSLIGDTWGEEISSPTTAGSTFSRTVTCELPANVFEGEKCRVVAFVSNYATDVNNRKVYNAAVTHNITGIHDIDESLVDLTVYPNPVMDVLNITTEIAIDRIEVYNLQGQLVKYINGNVRTIDLCNLSAGTYMLNIITDAGLCVKKIVKE